MLDPVGPTDHVEAHRSGIDGAPVARLLGELDAIIGENGVDLIGQGFDHALQKLPGGLSVSRSNELGKRELVCPVDADEEVELAFSRLNLGNVEVEKPYWIALEPVALGLVAFDIQQARDAMTLKAPMQR